MLKVKCWWPAIRWASSRCAMRSRAPFCSGQRKCRAGESGFPGRLDSCPRSGTGDYHLPRPAFSIERFSDNPHRAHCFFEWIYFSNVASTLDDRSVYLARKALGEELARMEDLPLDEDTIVVPVPDTSKAAADSMAFQLGIPSIEGLIRNRYSGRTFIEGGSDRVAKAAIKYTPLPEVLADKKVILVEDSIVRSTTMRVLISKIREVGRAREIHVRVACPPDYCPLLLRHRHVDDQRVICPAVSKTGAKLDRACSRRWLLKLARIRYDTCPSNPSLVRSPSQPITYVGPV